MARPRGSGQGFVGPVATRVDQETFDAIENWRAQHGLSQAEAVRRLLRGALEDDGILEEITPAEQERAEALLRARADLHRALNLAWEKVTED